MSDQKTTELTFNDVVRAHNRIRDHIEYTGIISNKKLDEELGAKVFFKMEDVQKTKSFKARGAFNAILNYKEKHGNFPEKIVVQSSGNHAQAVAFVGKKFNIPVIIYMAKITSPIKVEATRKLGAEVILCEKRSEANRLAEEKQQEGYFFIHPSDNDYVIAGQGTCVLEAIEKTGEVSAIFAPCGGGGLLSGCLIAKNGVSPQAQVFGCEPLSANDASRSVLENKIVGFEESPITIADGARTLKVAERCFNYLKKLNGILEISEEEIIFWQKELEKEFQEKIEPTSALSIAGCAQYLKNNLQAKNQKFLVIISGGNL
jgi:threonine dehydratase